MEQSDASLQRGRQSRCEEAGEVIHASVPVALIAVQMASASSGIEGRQAPAPLQWQ